MSAAVRDALLEMIDEEMESEMQIGDAEDEHALDFLMQGEMNLEDIKIELAHFLLKGRDSLGRALKCFMLAMCQEEAVRQGVEEEVNSTAPIACCMSFLNPAALTYHTLCSRVTVRPGWASPPLQPLRYPALCI